MLLFACGSFPGSLSAAPNYVLRPWQAEDGLPQNTVTAIVQTREDRWQGRVVLAVEADNARRLWVGIEGAGLYGSDYLLKRTPRDELLASIRLAHEGGSR